MFVCCPEKEAKERVSKLNDLKQLVDALEEKMCVPCSYVCCPMVVPPCCVCPQNGQEEYETPPPPSPPDIMVCYKSVEKKRNGRSNKRHGEPRRKKRAKSRELRASILYLGCDCEKRDGLQDDCRRTGCHGSPECLTKPNPICGPSEFSNGKHLGKKFNNGRNRYGSDDNGNDDCNETVYYNCYPAIIQC